TILICGKSLKKLEKVKARYAAVEIFACDLVKKEECQRFTQWIKEQFPTLNVVINNAAIVYPVNFFETEDIEEMAENEMAVNFLAPLRIIKQLDSLLCKNDEATIINITTGLIYAPSAKYSIYNATKAALHSFTQVLRLQAEERNYKIIEVMFPAVDTPWHQGKPPAIAISVQQAVRETLKGIKKGKEEIRVGGSKAFICFIKNSPCAVFTESKRFISIV
ncbi:MAG: SDR family NAD(P)-dependent oxidoreductase, partial [Bacteroidota bacterium]